MGEGPGNTRGEKLNQRGIELADRGWLDEALCEFDRAIELDGQDPFPRINRASVYVEQGRMLDALEDLLAAVKLAPDDPTTHYHLGALLTGYGHQLGKRELQISLAMDPDQVDALLELGVCSADIGEFEEAEQAFRSALELDPDDGLARRELGVLLLDRGEVHEAIEHLKTARQQLGSAEAEVDLGLAYLQAGFLDKAESLLVEVLASDEDNIFAHYNLAAIYAHQGRVDACLLHLQRAAEIHAPSVREWLRDDPFFEAVRREEPFQRFASAAIPDMG
ncbi:MAG: tetratricopeptide repeat protein [Deltaproteobacteria bacterium]|nr:tetratricopeptide repeat protein [Deltaproteobacteria bacterium]